MRLQQLFYFTLLLSPVVNDAFPFYELIHTSLTALYANFNPNEPILTKVAFWGSFVVSSVSTIHQGIDVCRQCEANKEEPNWDCGDAVTNLGGSVVLNAISLYIGWQHAVIPIGALEGADTSVIKRHFARQCNETIFTVRIVLLISFLIIMPVVVFMGGMRCHIMDLLKEILNFLTYT